MTSPTIPNAVHAIDWARYDFIDLGSSSGKSIQACAERFGADRGLGVDLNPTKVAQSRKVGFDAIVADACDLRATDVVRFVSALDFFEHLPNLDAVRKAIAGAARAATDFIYISHPSFEAEHYLRSLGLTQYWHNWSGHTCHVRICDYVEIFRSLGLHCYTVCYIDRVHDSDHYSILPDDLPKNQFAYDPEIHGHRPAVPFDDPVWRAQRILVSLRPLTRAEWKAVES